MTDYVTIGQLRKSIGSAELARLLAGKYDIRTLSAELVDAEINAEPEDVLTDFTQQERDDVTEALDGLDFLIGKVDKDINDNLRLRYALPIEQAVIDNSALPAIAEDLLMFNLNFNRGEAETTAYNEANKKLKSYREGKMTLAGATEPAADAPTTTATRSAITVVKAASGINWGGY
jgi:hypothetical protein